MRRACAIFSLGHIFGLSPVQTDSIRALVSFIDPADVLPDAGTLCTQTAEPISALSLSRPALLYLDHECSGIMHIYRALPSLCRVLSFLRPLPLHHTGASFSPLALSLAAKIL